MKPLAYLTALAFLTVAPVAGAQVAGSPVPQKIAPTDVSGAKIANGIRIRSQHPDNPFSIELAGQQIRALSAERLIWEIDGKTIELEVATFPSGAALSRSAEDLLRIYRDWDFAATRKNGWEAKGTAAAFACADKPCLAWSSRRPRTTEIAESFRHAAAVMNNDAVIVLSAVTAGGAQESELKAYLEAALRTVKREEPPAAAAPQRPNINDPDYRGASLEEVLRLGDILGQPHAGLVNKALITAKDGRLPNVIPLEPAALLEFTRFMLESGLNTHFQLIVFDGRSAHAVNATGALADSDTFEYWDPWGRGSFLQEANNAAGVDAVQHPAQPRTWMIKGQDLERVLYAAVLPRSGIIQAFRLFALLEGSPDALIAALPDLRSEDAEGAKQSLIGEEQLRKLARYLQGKRKHDQARAVFRAIVALYPGSGQAEQELAKAHPEDARAMPPDGAAPAEPQRLSAITQTDFFKFFNLRRVDAQDGQRTGETVVRFKPQADAFHPLVTVLVTVDREERVLKRHLVLSHSFITDPRQGLFARDIAKSHLLESVDKDEQPAISDLVAEIFRTGRSVASIPGARRQGATVPRLMSAGYLAFTGQRKDYQRNLKKSAVMLANTPVENVASLSITVERVP
jgi:hypothetical protein